MRTMDEGKFGNIAISITASCPQGVELRSADHCEVIPLRKTLIYFIWCYTRNHPGRI